jgi:translation initiation factor eIF-2B subunit gamma
MTVSDKKIHAIVLVDAAATKLAHLTDQHSAAVLLPVANKPIIHYVLDTLAKSGIKEVTLAGSDDVAMQSLSAWCRASYSGPCHVDTLCDTSCAKSSVNLIRRSLPQHCDHVLVVGGYLISDVSLRAQILSHEIRGAAMTMLMKVHKGPQNAKGRDKEPVDHKQSTTDYVSIQDDGTVSVYCHAQEKMKDIKVSEACLSKHVHLTVRNDAVDMKVYLFRKETLERTFEDKSGLIDVQKHLIPYLVRFQLVSSTQAGNSMSTLDRTSSTNLTGGSATGSHMTLQNVKQENRQQTHAVVAHPVGESVYCQNVDSVASYANINREILAPENSSRFIDSKSHIGEDVSMGNKSTVGNGSIVGSRSTLGDRSSVKRSVVGEGCTIGASCKIINCILHDGVILEDGCHLQNTIICRNAKIVSKVSMKDCHVASGVHISEPGDYKSEEFLE